MVPPIVLVATTVCVPPVVLRVAHARGSRGLLSAIALLVCLYNALFPALLLSDSTTSTNKAIVLLLYTWLANFKSIGLCLQRGPLCSCVNIWQYILIYNLPMIPVLDDNKGRRTNARQHESLSDHPRGLVVGLVGKVVALLVVTVILCRIDGLYTDYYNDLPLYMQCVCEICDCIGLYAFISIIMQAGSVVLQCLPATTSMRVAVDFDKPWESTSLTDFWSRRWNLNTGYSLRYLVYDVIVEQSLVKRQKTPAGEAPPRMRRMIAMMAAFAVSGMMHEMFLVYLRYSLSSHGMWMAFFTIQGPCILLFDYHCLKGYGARMHPSIKRVATLTILFGLAHVLFFPDIVRMGIPREVHDNVSQVFRLLLPNSTVYRYHT
ncbi:Acyl-CoA--sterol O-acyltransferase 1 [Picochlorum sp. SENEW3]|nr:Acyl-CoA--sterol O-acyltransferase 1 [Picochlorum sp. SENEW3]